MLVGDYLFVSKVSYGPKLPNTPLAVPFTHHTLPFTRDTKAYSEAVHWPYKRIAGTGEMKRTDIVVFNFPAGDTVIGVLAATLAAGNSLEEACFFANAAAGVVVGKLGTSTVSPIELENAVRGRADTGFGVMTEEELKLAVAAARKRGEKVVMTNGVFDILHAGHVSYLANARKLGDRLIVAVNSDASTKRLKGDSRPVNPLEQRMIVLGALEAVDWVVSFEEDTPQRLIAGILPDLLVKGGDYKPEEIAGSKEVWANGGEVLVLNFEE